MNVNYEALALVEIDKCVEHFFKTIRRKKTLTLETLKESFDDLAVRALQIKESDSHIREALTTQSFPVSIVDVILDFTFVSTEGITVWQSSAFTEQFKGNTVGYPPHAFERLNPENYGKHRPEKEHDDLTENESFAREINNTIMDELDCLDPSLVSFTQPWEWVSLFTTYLFDGEGQGFVWLTTVVSFSENSSYDHLLEIGHRCQIPPEHVNGLARYLQTQIINFDSENNTILLECADDGGETVSHAASDNE